MRLSGKAPEVDPSTWTSTVEGAFQAEHGQDSLFAMWEVGGHHGRSKVLGTERGVGGR